MRCLSILLIFITLTSCNSNRLTSDQKKPLKSTRFIPNDNLDDTKPEINNGYKIAKVLIFRRSSLALNDDLDNIDRLAIGVLGALAGYHWIKYISSPVKKATDVSVIQPNYKRPNSISEIHRKAPEYKSIKTPRFNKVDGPEYSRLTNNVTKVGKIDGTQVEVLELSDIRPTTSVLDSFSLQNVENSAIVKGPISTVSQLNPTLFNINRMEDGLFRLNLTPRGKAIIDDVNGKHTIGTSPYLFDAKEHKIISNLYAEIKKNKEFETIVEDFITSHKANFNGKLYRGLDNEKAASVQLGQFSRKDPTIRVKNNIGVTSYGTGHYFTTKKSKAVFFALEKDRKLNKKLNPKTIGESIIEANILRSNSVKLGMDQYRDVMSIVEGLITRYPQFKQYSKLKNEKLISDGFSGAKDDISKEIFRRMLRENDIDIYEVVGTDIRVVLNSRVLLQPKKSSWSQAEHDAYLGQ